MMQFLSPNVVKIDVKLFFEIFGDNLRWGGGGLAAVKKGGMSIKWGDWSIFLPGGGTGPPQEKNLAVSSYWNNPSKASHHNITVYILCFALWVVYVSA